MFDLSSYITGLLFIHDCVILPGFGGFVANYQEAVHDETSNTFAPPSKKLVFNSNLSYNDGLLINYLSRQLGIRYEEAEQMVKQSVEDAWIRLEKGETLKFEGIGSFRYNEDSALIFDPQVTENLLSDSYGLFSFRFPPLSYQTKAKTVINNDNIRIMPMIDSRKVLRYAAILIPIFGIVALIPFCNQRIQQSAGVVPTPVKTAISLEDTISSANTENTVDYEIAASTNKRAALFYNEASVSEPVKKRQADNCTYYIIGGSFKDFSNAEKYLKQYQKDGFNSEVVETDNLYRVSLGAYDDKVRALHELRRIRSNEKYGNAWLYSKSK